MYQPERGVSAALEVRAVSPGSLHLYRVEEKSLGPSLRMSPLQTLPIPGPGTLALPARSVTVLTGFELSHEDDGVTVEGHTPEEPHRP